MLVLPDERNDDCECENETCCDRNSMEDEVFDDVDGYLNYLGNPFDDLDDNLRWDDGEDYYYLDGNISTTGRDQYVWFERPHLPLDYVDSEHEYGGVIWAKYLALLSSCRIFSNTGRCSGLVNSEANDGITSTGFFQRECPTNCWCNSDLVAIW